MAIQTTSVGAAPNFAIPYSVTAPNIGAGYAAGITQAGSAISDAIKNVADIGKQNVDANDTLAAMKAGGILSNEDYQSVMGKSLGAKQTMMGLYAGQYLADQAARRSQALQMGKSTADIATEHAKLLQTIQAVKEGYGVAAGVNTGKLQTGGGGGGTGGGGTGSTGATGAGGNTSGSILAGTPENPTPLGSGNIYNPVAAVQPYTPSANTPVVLGTALTAKDPIPPGARSGTFKGQKGYLLSDGVTFRPIK